MSYHVRIMKSAQTDIRDIYRHISEDLAKPKAAVKRVKKIEDCIRLLKDKPTHYTLVQDDYLESMGLRIMVVKSHFLFFVIREDKNMVSVIRVLFARREWMRMLKIGVEQLFADDYGT